MKIFEFVIIPILLLSVAFMMGFVFGVDGTRRDAIEYNVGYYTVNPSTGQVQFVWNTNSIAKKVE